MSCNGNVYNIGMGCCEPVLGPVENYYTKPTIDRKLEEITSAITSGCCITPEEVDEKIASAKTEIEAEIPTVPTSNTAFTNDAGYLTEHQSLSGYATTAFVSAFTYDKATIDEKTSGGGSFDPSQYYNKTATDELLAEKLDATAYTPTDLSNYYTKREVDNEIISAITDVEAEIPTVPTSNTAFTNDAGYITGVDLSNYATKDNLTAATSDMATKSWVGQQGYLTQHQDISGKQDISGMTAYTETSAFTAHTSDNIIHVTNSEKAAWNAKADIWVGDETAWGQISGSTTNGTIYLVY